MLSSLGVLLLKIPRKVDFRKPTGTGQRTEAKCLSQHYGVSDEGEEQGGAAVSLEGS